MEGSYDEFLFRWHDGYYGFIYSTLKNAIQKWSDFFTIIRLLLEDIYIEHGDLRPRPTGPATWASSLCYECNFSGLGSAKRTLKIQLKRVKNHYALLGGHCIEKA